jgi:hypothetical protein
MADEIRIDVIDEIIKRMAKDHMVRWMMIEMAIQEQWKKQFDMVTPLPGPRPDPQATMKLQAKIFDNTKTAMAFSENMLKTFKETGIELEDDETFACAMYVVKKPTHISEVTGPHPVPSLIPCMLSPDSSGDLGFPFGVIKEEAWPPIRYIMEPAIMEPVMKSLENGKIIYNK